MESLMSAEPDQVTDRVAEPATEESARRRNPLVVAGVVLVAIAVVCAAVFATLWVKASHDDSLTFSRMRDQALQAAEQGSVNLTTLDYRHVRQDLGRWKASATGSLYQALTSGGTTFTKQVVQAKSITKGTVKDGVITELDVHAGKASALVYVSVAVTVSGGKTTTKLLPLQWNLTLTKSGWKLSGTGQNSPASGQ
jgi:Mce-associated membrane protein